jgi:23S rRNA (cytosine1962-C5)-methyltransferase
VSGPHPYLLLDAGDGRRLDRFGGRVVDRPAPGATNPRRSQDAWAQADLRYDRRAGWSGGDTSPWPVTLDGLTLEARATEAGQVGLFPEHAQLWPRLQRLVRRAPGTEVLHLFAHTGATTLALARAGARVAHVDASRPAVAWARRNADLSGLAVRPVRWLVDDAPSFVERERRRERRYRGFVIDPPAWGHGPGRAWRMEDDLDGLLAGCARLADREAWILLTAHSVGWDPDRLADALANAFGPGRTEAGRLGLEAASGATLDLGAWASLIIRT